MHCGSSGVGVVAAAEGCFPASLAAASCCFEQVSLLEGRDERMAESSAGSLGGQPSSPRHRAKLPPAAAEIHLQARLGVPPVLAAGCCSSV